MVESIERKMNPNVDFPFFGSRPKVLSHFFFGYEEDNVNVSFRVSVKQINSQRV